MFEDLVQEKKEEKKEEKRSIGEMNYEDAVRKIKEHKKGRNLAITCPSCHDIYLDHVGGSIISVDGITWDVNTFRCKGCGHVFYTKWRA